MASEGGVKDSDGHEQEQLQHVVPRVGHGEAAPFACFTLRDFSPGFNEPGLRSSTTRAPGQRQIGSGSTLARQHRSHMRDLFKDVKQCVPDSSQISGMLNIWNTLTTPAERRPMRMQDTQRGEIWRRFRPCRSPGVGVPYLWRNFVMWPWKKSWWSCGRSTRASLMYQAPDQNVVWRPDRLVKENARSKVL